MGSCRASGRVPDGSPLRRIVRVPGNTRVTIDGGHQFPEAPANPADNVGIVRRIAFGCVLLAAAISADIAISAWSLREHVLLALVAVLAVMVGLLLRRHRLIDQRLAAERRQLAIAVNNIPQGLILYDASARIIICNQPYIEMFGLSPDVVNPAVPCSA
jgi:PAS domain-containing protein